MWSMRERSCNKFKFLHLINYSLLTGIDFLYFGSVDQVWRIFNRLVGRFSFRYFPLLTLYNRMQISWSGREESGEWFIENVLAPPAVISSSHFNIEELGTTSQINRYKRFSENY